MSKLKQSLKNISNFFDETMRNFIVFIIVVGAFFYAMFITVKFLLE